MTIDNQTIIGEIVAADYRAADVFSKYGIDYCCQGGRSLEEACQSKALNTTAVAEELQTCLSNTSGTDINYDEWPIDLLADFVVQKHHKYVENSIPVLRQNLDKLCRVHGSNHPELFKITELFNALASDMIVHMKKEELMLFPFIRKLRHAQSTGDSSPSAMFGSVENPVNAMRDDHSFAGELLLSIKNLTNNYAAPDDACTTYRVTYSKLEEFQNDMFMHVHLENNIMFPKAINLEKALRA